MFCRLPRVGFKNSFAPLEHSPMAAYKPPVHQNPVSHFTTTSPSPVFLALCLDDLPSLYSPSRPPPLPQRANLQSLSSAETPTSAAAASSRTRSPQSVCSRRERHAAPASIIRLVVGTAQQGTRAQTARTASNAEPGRTLAPARRNVRSVHTEHSRAVSTANVTPPYHPFTDSCRRLQSKPRNT